LWDKHPGSWKKSIKKGEGKEKKRREGGKNAIGGAISYRACD